MKKILVIFTGGTIGSTVLNGTINTYQQSTLLQQFTQHYPQPADIEFDSIYPMQILSENLSSDVWKLLINTIEAQNLNHYAGIIITHGTDTIAYSAAALSFYFRNLKIPIFMVSSNYPLNHPEANGLENFIYAVNYIAKYYLGGVFVPYRNSTQNSVQLHQGTRLGCSLQLSADFFSVANTICTSPRCLKQPAPPLKAKFSKKVIMIKPYPNFNYNHVNLTGAVAVLHDLYHSGTACVAPFSLRQNADNYSLINFIKRCSAKNIKVYLSPVLETSDIYQSTQILIDNGAEIIFNTTIEASYVKLLFAYGNFTDAGDISSFIHSNIAGEHIVDHSGVDRSQFNCLLCKLYS